MAAGIGAGHAVVTVPNTFIATSEAISQTGARPYFVDVDERTYNMDPAKLREFFQEKCSRNALGEVMTDLGQMSKRSFRFTCMVRWPTWTPSWTLRMNSVFW